MSGNDHITEGLGSVIGLAADLGKLELDGKSPDDVAREVLRKAVDRGIEAIPDTVPVTIGGTQVDLPVEGLARMAEPAIIAALDALVEALSVKTVEVLVEPGATVRWNIQ